MLAQFVENLTAFVEQIVLTFGAPGIALIAFMENIFPPTPSEFLYPLAGKLAYDGEASLVSVIAAGAVGSIIGAFIFYHLGYYLGAERARRYIERYGTLRLWRWRIPLFTAEAYDRAVIAFEKRGGIIVMIARTMPLIHGVISIPAGVIRMNLLKFMLYSFIGALLWIAPTVLLGYFLGSQWKLMLDLLNTYETVWYIVFVLLVLYYIFSRWRNHRAQEIPDAKG